MKFVLLGSLGWMKARAPVEFGTFEEVLLVKKTCREG